MRDRRERILKLSCLVLGTLLAAELLRFMVAGDPAKGLVIPALPTLPAALEAQSAKATNSPTGKSTNTIPIQASANAGTNQPGQTNSTNLAEGKKTSGVTTTNSENAREKAPTQSNNAVAISLTNQPQKELATNGVAGSLTDAGRSNVANLVPLNQGTNITNLVAATKNGTNSSAVNASAKTNTVPPGRMAMGMPMGMGMGMPGGKPPELSADIKDRVDRIVQGEILGQVMRPMPMALLGIAGPNAFLRSPDGQTGMIKEGENLGKLKLLRIGNNRVLVEEEGEKKELTIFAGLGSDTLMPAKEPPKEKKPNEPTTKSP